MPDRKDGRAADELRPVSINPHFTMHAEGSVLISTGDTRVLCTASVEDKVPPFLRGQGKGWVTGEYGMLPRATNTRTQRDASKGKISGRTQEIQRLIGRALRSVVDLRRIGERTIWVDCDVLQADGGTRTASITGGFVALALALQKMKEKGQLKEPPLYDYLGAVSVGIIGAEPRLDLDYLEDSNADVDMNVVMTGRGYFVEVQGTAEQHPFSRKQMDAMMDLAGAGIESLIAKQKEILKAECDNMEGLLQTLKSFTIAPLNRDK